MSPGGRRVPFSGTPVVHLRLAGHARAFARRQARFNGQSSRAYLTTGLMTHPAGFCCKCISRDDLLACTPCADKVPADCPLVSICKLCARDPVACASFGSIDAAAAVFTCTSCARAAAILASKSAITPLSLPSPERFITLAEAHTPWMFSLLSATADAKRTALSILKREHTDRESAVACAIAADVSKSQAITTLMAQQGDPSVDPKVKAISKNAIDIFARQHLPHIKFRNLLDPQHGGSMERALTHFRSFDAHAEPLVRALAAERLFILKEIIKAHLPPPSRKAGEHRVVPSEALLLGLFVLRRLSREVKDAAAAPSEASTLFAEYYGSIVSTACVDLVAVRAPAPSPVGTHSHADATLGTTAPKASKRSRHDAKRTPFPCVDTPASLEEARRILDDAGNEYLGFCRNCYLALRGKVKHPLRECKALKHPCLLKCSTELCNGATHWRADCPNLKPLSASRKARRAPVFFRKGIETRVFPFCWVHPFLPRRPFFANLSSFVYRF